MQPMIAGLLRRVAPKLVPQIDKEELLAKLPAIEFVKTGSQELERLDTIGLSASLLMLADIGHEQEYALCRSVAVHLLGEAHEPDDAELSQE